ncbi:hypothetical protein DM806_15180 [Sphingobium lactosutens]|nr:hypothetical protein [Sphingobium lactosutens]
MRRHIRGRVGRRQGLSPGDATWLAAENRSGQSLIAITAKGDSISRSGMIVPPRKAATGMQ